MDAWPILVEDHGVWLADCLRCDDWAYGSACDDHLGRILNTGCPPGHLLLASVPSDTVRHRRVDFRPYQKRRQGGLLTHCF